MLISQAVAHSVPGANGSGGGVGLLIIIGVGLVLVLGLVGEKRWNQRKQRRAKHGE